MQDDAQIGGPSDRYSHAVHWDTKHKQLDGQVREHGPVLLRATDFQRYKLMEEFSRHVGDIPAYVDDVLVPRDRPSLSRDGFALVKGVIDQALA